MSGNIMIRKARNNYVCECCGHIIRAGSEYLDKVILNNGKCVQHDRYHDVCPKTSLPQVLPSTILFLLIAYNEYYHGYIHIDFSNLLHPFFSTFSIPSTSCSTNGPSLHSNITLFASIASIVCQTPFGIFMPYRPFSAHSTTSSIIEPSSL